jgi:hypothetical protein
MRPPEKSGRGNLNLCCGVAVTPFTYKEALINKEFLKKRHDTLAVQEELCLLTVNPRFAALPWRYGSDNVIASSL